MRKQVVLILMLALGVLGIQALLAVPQSAAVPEPSATAGDYCLNNGDAGAGDQPQNPCNPCAKKKAQNPCNPCAKKKAQNPCNPCAKKAQNPCNPCGKMAAAGMNLPPVNPCHAKLGTVFYVADPMKRNMATFKSRAPLEDIVGTTNEISGYVVFDPNQPKKGGHGVFRVPVASLNTGIPLRDEHLQSADWLNAARHGEIAFEITEVKNIKEVRGGAGKTFDVTLAGNLTLHGQTRRIEAPARITYLSESPQTQMKLPGDLLAARTNFTVKLSDFGVRGMQGVVGSRVSDSIEVEVSFVGSSKAPGTNM